jgi:hypothetical protein
MSMIWRMGETFHLAEYASEADLESAIGEIASELFGPKRIYLNVKKKIGKNIPDGYLLDLSGRQPKLYFVEVETSEHDLFGASGI